MTIGETTAIATGGANGDAPPRPPLLIFLIAGEPSGDALGGRLMAALRERTGGAVRFAGIGGERMAAEGITSLVPLAELAIMGVAEVLPRARRIFRRVAETVADILRAQARRGRHHRQFRLHLADRATAQAAR